MTFLVEFPYSNTSAAGIYSGHIVPRMKERSQKMQLHQDPFLLLKATQWSTVDSFLEWVILGKKN